MRAMSEIMDEYQGRPSDQGAEEGPTSGTPLPLGLKTQQTIGELLQKTVSVREVPWCRQCVWTSGMVEATWTQLPKIVTTGKKCLCIPTISFHLNNFRESTNWFPSAKLGIENSSMFAVTITQRHTFWYFYASFIFQLLYWIRFVFHFTDVKM